MNIDKLQTFKTLCETMSFTKTAEELYTSQPNVTKQIKSLEEELGYPLIERTHKSFTLTEYGKLFYSKSEHSVKEVETWRYYDTVIPVFEKIFGREAA